ncbi:MAG: DNA polymerase I [Candidatus Omnitrophota bacterium]
MTPGAKKNKKAFLIDGNSYCYRAYYAIKELRTSGGQPTNAVYGFLLMLKKLLADKRLGYIAVAFDLKGPTFRHDEFKEYKIQRKPMPDELVMQIPIIKDMLKAYNIAIFEKTGFEADDVLATIASFLSKKGLEVYIVTGDKDALQLVTDNVKVYNTQKDGIVYDKKYIKERFGVEPDNIVDIVGLMGDAIDNIPGVHGIGEKTAIELISRFKNIENLYENIEEIESQSRKKLLLEGRENAFLSKKLAILDINTPIDMKLEDIEIKDADPERLLSMFKELEFKSLAKEILSSASSLREESVYKTISGKKELADFMELLKKQKEFSMDFETTSKDPLEAELVGISFSWEEAMAYYIVIGQKIRSDELLGYLRPILENGAIKKIGQNIKYEKIILSRHGIDLKGIDFDTMIASYLLNPSKINHNLDDLSLEYLDHKMISFEELVGKGKDKIGIDKVPIEKISEYSCEDADVTFRLKKILEKLLFEKELDKLFREIELPLVDVLSCMEERGVKIDTGLLKKLSKEMEEELSLIIKNIYKMAGTEFNINSPKQLAEILFEKMSLPTVKKTKTGYSTDVGVLERLSALHPLPKELLRYRELSKLKSTYIDALPGLINKETKRLHTSFNQTITATGRLSSSSPNLQNIPVKTVEGRKIRGAFIGEKDTFIMSADYSQIELRILAHLSRDEELIKTFEEDRDVHTHTASLIFDVDEKDVTQDMRNNAKAVNFGIVYGISAFGLSRSLSIDPQSAQQFIENYFERYPRVKLYIDETIENAKDMGYVMTLFNRRRYVPLIVSENIRERQQAERIAINAPIQGSAADLIKIAMIAIHNKIREMRLGSIMTLQVHDELVFEVPAKELEVMKDLVKREMEGAIKLRIPTKISLKYGRNWLETKEL